MMETTQTGFGGWQGAPQFNPAYAPQFGGPMTGAAPGGRLAEFAAQRGYDIGDLVRSMVEQRLQHAGGRELTFDLGDIVRVAVAVRLQTGEPLLGGPGPDIGDIVRTIVGSRIRGGQSDIGDLVRGVIGARIQAGGPLLGGEADVGDLVRAVVGARLQAGGPLLDVGDLVKAIALTCAMRAHAGGQGVGQGFGQAGGGFGYRH